MPRSTVSAWLRRLGISRRPSPPPVPGAALRMACRRRFAAPGYQTARPLPACRASRPRRSAAGLTGVGWEYVHVAIDDHTRLAYVDVRADQRGPACAAFLQRALAWYRARGIVCQRVLTRQRQWLRVPRVSARVPGRRPAAPAARVRARRAPTARRSASSRRCCGNGRTLGPTPPRRNDGRRCDPGCGTAIASAPTRVSAISRRSPGCRELPNEQRV